MNLLDIKNLIFLFLKENDTIVLPNDFLKILNAGPEKVVTDMPEFYLESIKTALTSFEEAGLLKKLKFSEGKNEKTGYILEKPLQSITQTVELSGDTCYYLANTLNSIRDQDSQEKSNPLSIAQADVEELLILTSSLLQKYKDDLKKGNSEEQNQE